MISIGRGQACAIVSKSETTWSLLRVATKPKEVVSWSLPSSDLCQLGGDPRTGRLTSSGIQTAHNSTPNSKRHSQRSSSCSRIRGQYDQALQRQIRHFKGDIMEWTA
jgi:hypothetical protein